MNQPPIRTALLSYGMSGEIFHGPLLSAVDGFTMHSIVERRTEKAKHRYPSVRISKTIDDVMNDPDVELIVVNTPNETHFEYTERALENGKHVVVEKPFTVTSNEAERLINLSKAVSRTLTVFQNRRWDSDFLTIKRILKDGRLGKIVEFSAHYDRFRNYVEANTWKEESRPGTGILYNLGSHMLDQVVSLFGMPDFVDARIGIQRPRGKVDDFYDIRLQYPQLLVIVKSSYLVKEPMPRYILHGVNGSFVKFGIDPQEQALKDGRTPGDATWGMEDREYFGKINVMADGNSEEARISSERGDYREFYRNLFQVIRHGGELVVKPEEAMEVIRLIEACYESNRNRCAVEIRK